MATHEVLRYLRSSLDKKQVNCTSAERISKIANFFMSSSFDKDDILTTISPFFPKSDEIIPWYKDNAIEIQRLRRQDPKNYFTDRFDLEEESLKYQNSSIWMYNAQEGLKLMPLESEVNEAVLVVKILYKDAIYAHEHDDKQDLIA